MDYIEGKEKTLCKQLKVENGKLKAESALLLTKSPPLGGFSGLFVSSILSGIFEELPKKRAVSYIFWAFLQIGFQLLKKRCRPIFE